MTPGANVHLFVLQHGLWGTPKNLQYLLDLLQEKFQNEDIVFLNSAVNDRKLTLEGIDICGDRLVELVYDTIRSLEAEKKVVVRISFLGYSLGGLIVRYAAGKLHVHGLFDKITPVNLITVATPNLGSLRLPRTLWDKYVNWMIPVIASRTGSQLALQDGSPVGCRPLLLMLADPDLAFHQALSNFSNLTLLANVHYDTAVPYCTAAMCTENPYQEHLPIAMNEKYPSIVEPLPRSNEMAGKPRRQAGLGMWVMIHLLFPVFFVVVMTGVSLRLLFSLVRHKEMFQNNYAWLLASSEKGPAKPEVDALKPEDDITTASGCLNLSLHSLFGISGQSAGNETNGTQDPLGHSHPQIPVQAKGEISEDAYLPTGQRNWYSLEAVQKMQQQMVKNLNMLHWKKVDVDCGHYHAHAGIVVRMPWRFERTSKDICDYLASEVIMG